MGVIVMRNDGSVSPLKPSDLKEVADRDGRIQQLEQQCAVLAAEVDAQRPVVEAACDWARNDKGLLRICLRTAVINYEASKSK